jgi:regulator of protease activity HflC (stomatin/prohibitin superfamily)
MVPLIFALAIVGMILLTGVRVFREYERGVVFRLGRARKELAGPGLVLMLPLGVDRVRVVDLRTKVIQIPPQEVITKDNISIVVDAVVYITVESPAHAILEVEQYLPATLQLAATTFRTVIGRMDLDEILAHRDTINEEVRSLLDARTEQWGLDITAVELRDIMLPQEMKRAMARQAEAERERRAKVIAAEGEMQAAAKLSQAAEQMALQPAALQLRMYQALSEMAAEPASKIVIPVPIELLAGVSGSSTKISTEQITQLVQAALAQGASKAAPSLSAAAPKPSVASSSATAAVTSGAPPAPALRSPRSDANDP